MSTGYKKNIDKINWEELLNYRGEWVSYFNNKIIAHNKILKEVTEQSRRLTNSDQFTTMFVKPEWGNKICLPIYFKTVDIHPWKPFFEVKISRFETKNFISRNLLVDSGADISVISNEVGLEMGLTLAPNEKIYSANGVGGGVLQYVEREIFFQINHANPLKIPVAWIQDVRYNEMILGREVVFDKFNIEFIQAEEKIIFKERIPGPTNVI